MNDTHPKMAAMHIELLRQAGPEKRLEIAMTLSQNIIELQRAEISRQHPEWSITKVKLEWARRHYGEKIAKRIHEDLIKNKIGYG